MASAPVAAAAAVAAVALAVGAAAPPGPGPVSGPTAPHQFNPLVPYVSFGWLPAGLSPVIGGTTRQEVALSAGRKRDSPDWSLSVLAAGKCHLTAPVRGSRTTAGTAPASGPGAGPLPGELKCSTPSGAIPFKITGRAPAVRGRRAFWAGLPLVWQYARNGWAWLYPPVARLDSPQLAAYRREAVKIASQVRYGAATPPLLFPVQLTGLPSRWRVSSLTYVPDAGVLRVNAYALGAGPPDLGSDGGLVYETGLPYIDISPAGPRAGSCYTYPHHQSAREVINGYRVVVTHMTMNGLHRQDLCASNADGLSLYISQFGTHPAVSLPDLFGQHLRLLGRHPANWTPNPIG